MTTTKRRWTFMVYMAGDNGKVFETAGGGHKLMAPMEEAGLRDIAEMEQVGSSDQLAVLVQFDTLSDEGRCYRLYVRPSVEARQIEQIAEQNCGDPCSLRDFIIWGIERYPADRYAVVIWNHGAGWKEDDIYAFARQRNLDVQARPDEIRSAGSARLHGALFLSSALEIVGLADDEIRAIAYDDSSMDFLDNIELQRAFQEAAAATGHKISLIGMDACLMSMIEVAHQLRAHADCLVASQEVEPMVGWPYEPILRALADNPAMTPAQLATLIVQEYGRSFDDGVRGAGPRVTQSAVALTEVDRLTQAVGRVAAALQAAEHAHDPYAERALLRASRQALRFKDADYVDLHDFLRLLRDNYDGDDTGLTGALDEVLALLAHQGAASLMLANVALGDRLSIAHGLSIYWPDRGYSPLYDKLDFAACGWGTFIRAFNDV